MSQYWRHEQYLQELDKIKDSTKHVESNVENKIHVDQSKGAIPKKKNQSAQEIIDVDAITSSMVIT